MCSRCDPQEERCRVDRASASRCPSRNSAQKRVREALPALQSCARFLTGTPRTRGASRASTCQRLKRIWLDPNEVGRTPARRGDTHRTSRRRFFDPPDSRQAPRFRVRLLRQADGDARARLGWTCRTSRRRYAALHSLFGAERTALRPHERKAPSNTAAPPVCAASSDRRPEAGSPRGRFTLRPGIGVRALATERGAITVGGPEDLCLMRTDPWFSPRSS